MLKQGGQTALEINGVKHEVKVCQSDIDSFLKTGNQRKPPLASVSNELESPAPTGPRISKHNTETVRPDGIKPRLNLEKGILTAESLLEN